MAQGREEPTTETGIDRAPTIAARMNRLPITRTHRLATLAVGLGLFFEFYEVFLTGVLSSVLVKEFSLSKTQLPVVLASTFVGMFLGALVLGRIADRVGRRGAFLLNLGLYSVFSLLGAFSTGPLVLIATRFFAGLGLGAEPPLADTYLTDVLPARKRGRYIAWAYTLAFLGIPVVGFVAHSLAQTEVLGIAGWRWTFVLGALGAVVVFALRSRLPESPRWLESTGRTAEAEKITARFEAEAREHRQQLAPPSEASAAEPGTGRLRELVSSPYRRRTGMMIVFHILQTVGYYGFGTMVPLVLAAKGYAVSESLLYTAVTYLGYPIGSALSLPLVDRVERKLLVVFSIAGMAISGLAFGYAGSMELVLMFGFLYTAVSNVFSNSFHIYQAEIFPTRLRSTASSGTYSLSRLTTAAMPFALVPLLHDAGPGTLFTVISAALLVPALDVALLGPRTTGRELESVNAQAPGPASQPANH